MTGKCNPTSYSIKTVKAPESVRKLSSERPTQTALVGQGSLPIEGFEKNFSYFHVEGQLKPT